MESLPVELCVPGKSLVNTSPEVLKVTVIRVYKNINKIPPF